MATILVASEGDTETQECNGVPCVGGGTYSIMPVTDQEFVYIKNKLIIPCGQMFFAHGVAFCECSTTLLYINGVAAVRDGDSISHSHVNTGVDVSNQSFVYSE